VGAAVLASFCDELHPAKASPSRAGKIRRFIRKKEGKAGYEGKQPRSCFFIRLALVGNPAGTKKARP
jgi:hypothetical protein